MKVSHKINHNWQRPVEPITTRYLREVERSTAKAERAYKRALSLLAKAETRAARARATKCKTPDAIQEFRVANELVELRRTELKAIESLMLAVPASAEHRGIRSFRPVPPTSGGI